MIKAKKASAFDDIKPLGSSSKSEMEPVIF